MPELVTYNNAILVRPDENNQAGSSGVKIRDFSNPQHGYSVTGTVMAVPDRLQYYGRQIHKSRSRRFHTSWSRRERERMYASSTQNDTHMEISVGDTIVFPYFYHIHEAVQLNEYEIVGDDVLIPYDQLYCRVDDGRLMPLNGYLLARQMPEVERVVEHVGVKRMQNKSVFTIERAGSLNRHYLDYGRPDFDMRLEGKRVVIMQNNVTRIEAPNYNFLSGGKEPLCVFQRRHILGIYE